MSTAAPSHLQVFVDMPGAVSFLAGWYGGYLACLTAIPPDSRSQSIETVCFNLSDVNQRGAARAWIQTHQGRSNVYFVPNAVRGPLTRKPSRREMGLAIGAWVDLDPDKSKPLEEERERIRRRVDQLTVHPEAQPTVVIDSGGGYQAFWRFKEPVALSNEDARSRVEKLNKRLACILEGADHGVFDVCRLMRVPGTVNVPTASKRAAGREPAPARVHFQSDVEDWSFEELEDWAGSQPVVNPGRSGMGAGGKRKAIGDPSLLAPSEQLAIDALQALPQHGEYAHSRDRWVANTARFKAATGGTPEALDAWLEWCGKYEGGNDVDYCQGLWDSIHDASGGWLSLEAEARQHGFLGGAEAAGLTALPDETEEERRRNVADPRPTLLLREGHQDAVLNEIDRILAPTEELFQRAGKVMACPR